MDGLTILNPQVHANDVDPLSGQIVPGYTVSARDAVTMTVVKVFVPDAVYSAENVRRALEAKVEQVRAIAALNGPDGAGG